MRFLAISALFLSLSAQAFTVKECVDGRRSFKIKEDTLGRLYGEFQDFTGAPQSYGSCERIKRTYNYKCVGGKNIATFISNASRPTVQFELKGNREDNYLFSLYCD